MGDFKVLTYGSNTIGTAIAVLTTAGPSVAVTPGALITGYVLMITDTTPSPIVLAPSNFDTTADTVTITAHGLTTGCLFQIASTGTLPSGLSAATSYWVIVIDANTIQIASSLANALAGTSVDFTTQGTLVITMTFTALSVNVTLQMSADNVNWATEVTGVGATSTYNLVQKANPLMSYQRLLLSLNSGRINASFTYAHKGLA